MPHDFNTARAEWQTLRDELKAIDVEIASKDANDADLPRLQQARSEMRESMDAIKVRLGYPKLNDGDFYFRLRAGTPGA